MRRSVVLFGAILILSAAVAVVLGCTWAEGEPDGGPRTGGSGAPETASYCANLVELMGVLDDGGNIAQYNVLLTKIVDESPAGHGETWALLLRLSEQPFSYENFNPAVDALDRLALNDTCPGLSGLVVDDEGRIRGR